MFGWVLYTQMPYKIIKNRNQIGYKVVNKKTGKVLSKNTTLENAKKQIRLIYVKENIKSSS